MVHEHEHDDEVLELVIDHPPVNAFTIGDLHDLAARLGSAEDRPELRVVVLRGEGEGFCGGGDVKEVPSLPGFKGISRYRAELSYTYELNLIGEAQERRGDFVDGRRGSYLSASGS